MNRVLSGTRKSLISIIVATYTLTLFSVAMPITRYASATTCPTASGVSSPTGASARTYSWNPETCLWENAYYTWSPATNSYTARYDQTPVLNSAGTAWEKPNWVYVASSGTYVLRKIITPIPQESTTNNETTGTQTAANPASSSTTGGNTINNTGESSNNLINNQNNSTGNLSLTNNTNVNNSLYSTALSGNALVGQNTNGGSASTGNASATANYMTMIQSNWDPRNGPLNTFSADLNGSLYGDLFFNPNSILDTGSSSNNQINNANNSNLTVTVTDNANVNNDINMDARSGNATVTENTNAGSATTGDANVTANLINMINSAINSQSGFIGNININGTLDGDLLLPPNVMALIENTGYNSNNGINSQNNTNLNSNINNNYAITNNFDLNAQSGNATVGMNTNAGDANTGNAVTNVVQENLIGRVTSGISGLLVIVNNMGNWGGSISPYLMSLGNTGANSNNQINNENNTNVNLEQSENFSITNNINLNAVSGDATVTKNTNAGSATTGNATANANVLNLINSRLDYSEWFGVIFINVFGNWTGSFGTDTEAGGVSTKSSSTGSSKVGPSSSNTTSAPTQSVSTPATTPTYTTYVRSSSNSAEGQSSVAGATTDESTIPPANEASNASANVASTVNESIGSSNSPIAVIVLSAGFALGIALIFNRGIVATQLARFSK